MKLDVEKYGDIDREMNTYRADIVCILLVIFFSVGFINGKYQSEINNYLIEKIYGDKNDKKRD